MLNWWVMINASWCGPSLGCSQTIRPFVVEPMPGRLMWGAQIWNTVTYRCRIVKQSQKSLCAMRISQGMDLFGYPRTTVAMRPRFAHVCFLFLTKPETGYTRNSLLDMENIGFSMGFQHPSTIGFEMRATFGVSLEWKDETNYDGWSGFQMGVTFEGENLKILVELPARLVRLLEASNGRAIFHGILRFGMAHSFLPHEYQNKWRLNIALYCIKKDETTRAVTQELWLPIHFFWDQLWLIKQW